ARLQPTAELRVVGQRAERRLREERSAGLHIPGAVGRRSAGSLLRRAAMKRRLALMALLFIAPAGAQSLQESVTEVWVHDVPGPPRGDFWHPVTEHLLSAFSDPASIYPNVMVCARPLTVATPHCSSICWELKGDSHGNGQPSTACRRPLRVRLVANDPRMLLEIADMERVGERAQVHAII